jgi:hypothetical protein
MHLISRFNFLGRLLILTVISAGSGLAQSDTLQWTEVYDQKLAFSFMLPSEFLVDNEEQKDYFLSPVHASLPDVKYIYEKPVLYAQHKSLWVEVSVKSIRQTSNAKDHLWLFLGNDSAQAQDFQAGRFVGRRLVRDDDEYLGTYIVTATGSRVVTISAWAKRADRSIYDAFLRSLTFDGQKLFGDTIGTKNGQVKRVQLGELATSPEIREALQRPNSRLNFDKPDPTADFRPEPKEENLSRPLITLRQSKRPPYVRPEDRYVGTVKAKVRFLADGSLGAIQVFGDAPKLILRNIHSGLREIKFLPAQRDGRNIEIVRDFSFELSK